MNKTTRLLLISAITFGAAVLLFLGGIYVSATFLQPMIWGRGAPPGLFSEQNSGTVLPFHAPGGMMGSGMMGGRMGVYNPYPPVTRPLTIDETREAVQAYLKRLGNSDLEIKEIMIFDNNGYAIVVEKSTGIGAFELLIDPLTKAVFPEYGPNMMWNLKYGMMSGLGHGMMGGACAPALSTPDTSQPMPVSAEKARQIAQAFLDTSLPGAQVADEITPFYGYYTLDFSREGKVAGMLSVNGYTRQVFLHTWHGTFIEMHEEDEFH